MGGGGNNVCFPVIECFAERAYHCVSNIAAEARVQSHGKGVKPICRHSKIHEHQLPILIF